MLWCGKLHRLSRFLTHYRCRWDRLWRGGLPWCPRRSWPLPHSSLWKEGIPQGCSLSWTQKVHEHVFLFLFSFFVGVLDSNLDGLDTGLPRNIPSVLFPHLEQGFLENVVHIGQLLNLPCRESPRAYGLTWENRTKFRTFQRLPASTYFRGREI